MSAKTPETLVPSSPVNNAALKAVGDSYDNTVRLHRLLGIRQDQLGVMVGDIVVASFRDFISGDQAAPVGRFILTEGVNFKDTDYKDLLSRNMGTAVEPVLFGKETTANFDDGHKFLFSLHVTALAAEVMLKATEAKIGESMLKNVLASNTIRMPEAYFNPSRELATLIIPETDEPVKPGVYARNYLTNLDLGVIAG